MTDQPFKECIALADAILRKHGALEYADGDKHFDTFVEALALIHQKDAERMAEAATRNKLAHSIATRQGAQIDRPKIRGATQGRYALRDRQLIMAIFRLCEATSLTPTRNDEGAGISACDAVQQAWLAMYKAGEVPKPISYEYLKELWKQRPGRGLK